MCPDLPQAARRGGQITMVPVASLLCPWLTASSSSDSESSTRLHHSSYPVILLISSSILSGPTFPIVIFLRNLRKRFSHHGFPSRVPIDRGWVKAPGVGSFHTSRRPALNVSERSRTCGLIIVGGYMLSYLCSKNQDLAWACLAIRFKYTPESKSLVRSWEDILASLFRTLSIALYLGGGGIIVYFPRSRSSSVATSEYDSETFWFIQAIDTWCEQLVLYCISSVAWPARVSAQSFPILPLWPLI
jgi:hypothetical protein